MGRKHFQLTADQPWRTITPLTRASVPSAHEIFFIGDAARVVEPFTGEGTYYALALGRTGCDRDRENHPRQNRQLTREIPPAELAEIYRGRLWINRLARKAVVSPRLGSFLVHAARVGPRSCTRSLRKLCCRSLSPRL